MQQKKNNQVYFFVKRIFDIVLSFIGLVITSPVMLITAIFIFIDTPGSPIFAQKRVGKNNEIFILYKLRSMYIGSESKSWTDVNDKRITNVGRIIRRFRIDELPQLYNVLKGDMSIVGPRPEVPELSERFERLYPGYVERTNIKPGITGWAQVNGGYNVHPNKKAKLDRSYIMHQNVIFDLYIIMKTIGVLFTGHGAR